MSLNDLTAPTRRGFLRNALAAVASPVLPKGALAGIEGITEALPDLSGYALSSIPEHLIQYFGSLLPLKYIPQRRRCSFPNTYGVTTWDIICGLRVDDENPWSAYSLQKLLHYKNIDVNIIPKLPDGSPLLCGHVMNRDNHGLLHDWITIHYLEEGSIIHAWKSFKEKGFTQKSIEEIRDFPVTYLYDQIKICADHSIQAIVTSAMKSKSGQEIIFGEISDMPEVHLNDLIKRFPEHADFFKKADEFWERNNSLYERSNKHGLYPPGHFRMEKSGMGVYTRHAPEIR